MSNTYIIHGGAGGVNRLEILTQATWNSSHQFLKEAGLRDEMKVLEVGCGGGAITEQIAKTFKIKKIIGVDFDEHAIRSANNKSIAKVPNIEFIQFDITQSDFNALGNDYDFIYCRFVLSHLKNPLEVVSRLHSLLKSDGVLAVEDTQISGHFSIPQNQAFDQFVDLFLKAAKIRGAHPDIGPSLPVMLENSGFKNVDMRVSTPAFRSGPGKLVTLLTLEGIKEPSIQGAGISESEYNSIYGNLKEFTESKDSIVSLARIFQCWGKKE